MQINNVLKLSAINGVQSVVIYQVNVHITPLFITCKTCIEVFFKAFVVWVG